MARKQSRILNTAPPRKADDFRLIKGIGPVLAGKLYDAGVSTYNQLAVLSAARLAQMVTGLSVKQISRQDWSDQARKLATKKRQLKPSQNDSRQRSMSQHYENFTIEFLVSEKHAVRRTRVAHIQSGDADTWAGWEPRQLVDFLVRHTGVRMRMERPQKQAHQTTLIGDVQIRHDESQPSELEVHAPAPPYNPSAGHALLVKHHPLPAVQPPVASPPASALCIRKLEILTPGSDRPVTFLRPDQPYLIHLSLDLTEVNDPGDLPIIYKASVFAKQLGGTHQLIGEILSTIKFSKSATLDMNGSALSPGTYRLEAFAEIRYEEITPGPTASLKGGLLQIH